MVIMDADRIKTLIILEETAKVVKHYNTEIFVILTFLTSCIKDEEEKDVAQWLSFYAKMAFDKKYGSGAADRATDLLIKRKPKSIVEFQEVMEEFFDNNTH